MSGARLIITADDYGWDEAATLRIADHLQAGTVTAASVMANGPCFELACRLARERGLQSRIGVHLCLDEGEPLAQEMRTLAGDHLHLRRSLRPLGPGMARAVEAELAAQIERVLASGIRPSHVDSHRHVHTLLPVGRIVVRLARRYGIAYVRPARDLGQRAGVVRRTYKRLFNRWLARNAATADHFGDITDLPEHAAGRPLDGLVECMTHLDDSPRGRSDQALLASVEFRRVVAAYRLGGHDERRA